ncbi:MAG: TraR/DksA C4-type zinc finger protein [Actinomycetota bacterium]|nr:TraR/DksA C4-type zinc finger protein [Actinomycetota bacterium]
MPRASKALPAKQAGKKAAPSGRTPTTHPGPAKEGVSTGTAVPASGNQLPPEQAAPAVTTGAKAEGARGGAAPQEVPGPSQRAEAPKKEAPKKKAAVAKKALAAKASPRRSKRTVAEAAPSEALPDKFLQEQLALLDAERASYVEQAAALKAEADQLAQEMEPGDIQFDDESGEGGTANVDRERDLALSAQARVAVDEIDHARQKIASGTYGDCEICGQPIPRARLKALPHARLCVSCKSGGLSRR